MRWLMTLALLALTAWPAVAQKNEAEKLFRNMEEKLRTAKTLQLRFDSSVTIPPNTGSVKGTLILGEGDKLRLELGGKPFGVEFKSILVSDGTTMSSKDSTEPKKDKTQKAPNALGANVRKALPLLGVFVCFNGIDRGNWSPGVLKGSNFKLAGKEKIGEQNTQVIEYTVTEVKAVISPGKWRMKMWLDAQAHLPVKLTMTMDELADISATTDTFSEFAVDAKVDVKLFELPNGPAPKNLKGRKKEVKAEGAGLIPLSRATLTMQAKTDQPFATIVFSPDGSRLAGITVPGHYGEPAIYVWDATTGKRLFTRSWHKKAALSVRFNDDGTLLVASAPLPSENLGEVHLWDPVTMKSLRKLKGTDAGPVIFSPDGKLVTATGGQPTSLGLWDVATGKKVLALEGNSGPIAFSPDSKLLTGIDGKGRGQVWNVATGKLIQTLEGMFAGGDAFSPDSKRVAGGTGLLSVDVRVWEVASGRKLLELRDAHVKRVVSVAFSTDGKHLVTGGNRQHKSFFPEFLPAERDGEMKVWDAATGVELLAFRVTDFGVALAGMCLTPDGERIAINPENGPVTIWRLPSETPIAGKKEPITDRIGTER